MKSSSRMKSSREDPANIVEERIILKPQGETVVRKYLKGKQIGKGGFAK